MPIEVKIIKLGICFTVETEAEAVEMLTESLLLSDEKMAEDGADISINNFKINIVCSIPRAEVFKIICGNLYRADEKKSNRNWI